jgi:SAM-dependent methyltransferase
LPGNAFHSDAVDFHVGTFEDVALPERIFDAVFSTTAFHWVDPAVGWAKAARALRPGGMLALITHIGYREE